MDDIIVALVICQAFIEMSPPKIVDEHCEALGIDPDRVLIPVPAMISDAMEMFAATTGQRVGFGGRQPAYQGWGPPPEYYYPPEGHPHHQGRPPEPPYTRYSAYREDK